MLAWNTIGSPDYRTDEATLRQWVTRDVNRSLYPVGVARQMAAIVANGDRREKLKKLKLGSTALGADDASLIELRESNPGIQILLSF